MYFKKIIHNTNNINFNFNNLYPIFKKNDKIQLYWYRFIKNRFELIITKGIIIKLKKKQNLFQISTITLQQKLNGMIIQTKFQLNNISLIGIRLIK